MMVRWSSKRLRVFFVAVLLLGTILIVVSFLSRTRLAGLFTEGDLLEPDVARLTTQFERFEYRFGRVFFSVRAATSTEKRNGVHSLEEVRLAHYSEEGEVLDSISSRDATYFIDQRRIEFSGEVEVVLADGTHVHSRRVHTDLDRAVASIDERFSFQRGDVFGEGASLSYRIRDRELQIDGGFRLSLSTEEELDIRSRQAVYLPAEEQLDLIGDAEIRGSGRLLSSDRMRVFLTHERRVERILSSGAAHFHSPPQQTFRGQHINVFFEPDTGGVRYFEVLGFPGGEAPSGFLRAVYEEGAEGETHKLEAARITGLPSESTGDGRALVLRRFDAEGDVLYRSGLLGIEETRAQFVSGVFFPEGTSLRRLSLRQEVTIVRLEAETGARERLRSRELVLDLLPDGSFERVTARGEVQAEAQEGPEVRRISSAEQVEAVYQDGSLERILATGDSLVELAGPDERRLLRAPWIEVRYTQGAPSAVLARGGVAFEQQQEVLRSSRSDEVHLAFEDGVLVEAYQTGNVRLEEVTGSTQVRLTGDRARFLVSADRLEVTGRRPLLRTESLEGNGTTSETVAMRFQLDRAAGRIEASGRVRTVLREPTGELVVTAEEMVMDAESGWVNYSGGPRILQGENWIRGGNVRLDPRGRRLLVEGDVVSSLREGVGDRSYVVTAGSLTYDSAAPARARYEEDVQVREGTLTIRTPLLEIEFDEEEASGVKRLTGNDPVLIEDGDRRAGGRHLVFLPEEGKVVLSGDPAEFTDARGVRTSGKQLTFYTRNERITVEAPTSTPDP